MSFLAGSVAETRVGGRAVDARLVAFTAQDSWDVDVMTGGEKTRVRVDARNGAVNITRQPPRSER